MAAKERAKSRPDEIPIIAIDGSNQSPYAILYLKQYSDETVQDGKMRLKTIDALDSCRIIHFCMLSNKWESDEVLHGRRVALNTCNPRWELMHYHSIP